MIVSWLPSVTYWRESDRKACWKSAGSSALACCSRNATAWPMLTPGIGTAENVAEFSWLYWVSALGAVPVSIRTTVDSGTVSPERVFT